MSDCSDNETFKNTRELNAEENEILKRWSEEQNLLKQKNILVDTEEWENELANVDLSFSEKQNIFSKLNLKLRFVAGVDISFVKDSSTLACSGLIILDLYHNCKVIYEDIEMIELTEPYIPGYLAFREAPFLVRQLETLKAVKPEVYPSCIFVDGNGILHSKRFGLASHLGVLTNTPSIGIAKTLFHAEGIEKNEEHKQMCAEKLLKKGDYFELKSQLNNDILALCYRSNGKNPLYISIGHKISMNTCLKLVDILSNMSKYRILEPTRQADLRTREYLRQKLYN
jgi:endonuclease V